METVKSLIKEIHKNLPDFGLRGRLLFRKPIGHILQGICFESSSFSKTSFYPTVFVQGLYDGTEHIVFNLGGRLHGFQGNGWDLSPGRESEVFEDVVLAIKQQALPFLSAIKTPRDLALANENLDRIPKRLRWPPDDINVMETMAYSWLLSGEERKARFYLDEIKRNLKESPDDRDWVKKLEARADRFIFMLSNDQRDEALKLLNTWTINSAKALKLNSYVDEHLFEGGWTTQPSSQ